jgi:uncharacterized coiled-coil protein SlyX
VAADPRDDRIRELEQENARQRERIAELEREVADLRRVIEEWKRGHRQRSRRFSSRHERQRTEPRKPPGRKPGHPGAFRPVPERTDRTEPCVVRQCPDCGGAVEDTGVVETIKVEQLIPARIEVVAYQKRSCRCTRCGKTAVGSLPAELGPAPKTDVGVQALVVSLRNEFKMPLPDLVKFLGQHVGLTITEGGVSQMVARLARRTQATRAEIQEHIRSAPFVHMDETGWRQDGSAHWGWLAGTPWASLFHIDPSRSRKVVDALLGDRFAGVLITDFYSAYTSDPSQDHQWDWAHLIREAKKIAELDARRRPQEFRDRLRALYEVARVAQATQDPSAKRGIRVRFGKLIHDADLRKHVEVHRLQHRMWQHTHGLLRFLDDPLLPSDNNAAERDIRNLVRRRKVFGCTRSPRGSQTLAHWISIAQTLKKQGSTIPEYLPAALRAYHSGAPLPPIIRARC